MWEVLQDSEITIHLLYSIIYHKYIDLVDEATTYVIHSKKKDGIKNMYNFKFYFLLNQA